VLVEVLVEVSVPVEVTGGVLLLELLDEELLLELLDEELLLELLDEELLLEVDELVLATVLTKAFGSQVVVVENKSFFKISFEDRGSTFPERGMDHTLALNVPPINKVEVPIIFFKALRRVFLLFFLFILRSC
jgi:hypothetical protein